MQMKRHRTIEAIVPIIGRRWSQTGRGFSFRATRHQVPGQSFCPIWREINKTTAC
ncbi:hypothetical protein BDV33DRAFT_174201 [Aspergillus novoparasiticus]|uniref:Uncharacterized protein n=1 Tax=Aspergillus novoparasiticus TaxID=986946 RepID=A0A5N6ENL1_9EURO|nr:hypothetical protein BDV33DRAFT_174201 [Aspergillus novoparasiticus]